MLCPIKGDSVQLFVNFRAVMSMIQVKGPRICHSV